MKILVFTTLFPNDVNPNHGVFIKERMKNVSKYNEVKVVAPVPYFPKIKFFAKWYIYSQIKQKNVFDSLQTYHPRYFITPRLGMTLYGLFMFFSVISFIKKLREKYPFDIIDAHYIYPDGMAAILLAKFFKKPLVLSARGTDINLYPKFPLIKKQIIFSLKNADRIIAVCEALKKSMIKLGIPPEKISVVPNGVDTRKFHPVSKEMIRKKLDLPANQKIILSVGNLIERKGFHFIIEAFSILKNKLRGNETPLLVIVGEGEYRKILENLVDKYDLWNHVRLVGAVLHKNLYKWYSSCDIFCLASSREGWPNVLLEAMACGKPVVATNVWGVSEVIKNDKYGILVENQKPLLLAESLESALKKDWNHPEILRYARTHTWDNVAQLVINEFEKAFKSTLS